MVLKPTDYSNTWLEATSTDPGNSKNTSIPTDLASLPVVNSGTDGQLDQSSRKEKGKKYNEYGDEVL
jgi:hypothetical protein